MAFQERRVIRVPRIRGTGLSLAALVLLWLSSLSGCADESEQAAQSGDVQEFVAPSSAMIPPLGQAGLNERIFDAAVIARASLVSTNATSENIGTDSNGAAVYRGLLEFKFKILEYVKGTGGGELVVFVTEHRDITYATEELALEAARSWERARDTRWDYREALIIVEKPAGSSGQVTRYSFGPYGYIEAYTLDSKNRVWLPAATSGGAASASSGDMRFLLEEPGGGGSSGTSKAGTGQPETISVTEMKAVMAKLEKWVKDGEGVEGYMECIRASFFEEAWINGEKERGVSQNTRFDDYLDSGLPARTVIRAGGVPPPEDGNFWLGGKDKTLFGAENGNFISARPLPASEYVVYYNFQWSELIPCDYYPDEYRDVHAVHVTVAAPTGTLHEAFFDPVTLRQAQGRPLAVAADATNGVLKPASFTDANGASATIQGISWVEGMVEMRVMPHDGLADHVLDFIALDGSVTLSVEVDGASVDAARNTLRWSVDSRPWEDGDKLMVRIREGSP